MTDTIYLDYAATTPCDPEVVTEMLPYFSNIFGNPNSLHCFGSAAQKALNVARQRIASLLNSEFDEVIFTSGATESIRIALTRSPLKLATLSTEHKATLDLARNSYILDVQSDGLLDLESQLPEDVQILSLCMVNNETGVLQDIQKIVEFCHKRGVLVHVDATQAFGKLPIDVKALDVDFLSASGHKIYGPKGVGILFFKKSNMRLLRVPQANHEVEFGLRAGTVPVPLCVGMGKAAEIASKTMSENLAHITKLRNLFISTIKSQLNEIYINGSEKSNYPGIINMSFRGCEGEALMMEASRIAVSSGSACTSNKLSISHVLKAMGISPDIAQSSLRITIGKSTTEEEILIAAEDLIKATKKLRQFSPIWDMISAGVDIDQLFKKGH